VAEDGASSHRRWVMGRWWLYCLGTDLPVMWIGPARTQDGAQVPMYACEGCMRTLEGLVRSHLAEMDRA